MTTSLTDEQIEAVLGAAYRKLVLETGYSGGMGSETWDRAAARAIEAALLASDARPAQGKSPVAADAGQAGGETMVAPAHTGRSGRIYVTCHQCDQCQHIGINDEHATEAACNNSACGWHGPSPTEDLCPGCGRVGTMSTACPECGGHYVLLADADVIPALPAASEPASGAVLERAAFEAWAGDQGYPLRRLDIGDGDDYRDLRTQGTWDAWQARAALSTAGATVMGAGSEDERWSIDRAADFLEQYADFIRRDVMSVDIERHPYLPELEYVAGQMRHWFDTPDPAAVMEDKNG